MAAVGIGTPKARPAALIAMPPRKIKRLAQFRASKPNGPSTIGSGSKMDAFAVTFAVFQPLRRPPSGSTKTVETTFTAIEPDFMGKKSCSPMRARPFETSASAIEHCNVSLQ